MWGATGPGKNSRFHLYRQIAMTSEIEPQKPRDHVWHVELPRMKQLIARTGCPIGPRGPILGFYRFRLLSEIYSIRICVTSPTVLSLAGVLRLEHSCSEPKRRTKGDWRAPVSRGRGCQPPRRKSGGALPFPNGMCSTKPKSIGMYLDLLVIISIAT
jgi:hypothetical protein